MASLRPTAAAPRRNHRPLDGETEAADTPGMERVRAVGRGRAWVVVLALAALATPLVYRRVEDAVWELGCEGLGFGCSPERAVAGAAGSLLYLAVLGLGGLAARKLRAPRRRLAAALAAAGLAALAAAAPVVESRWPYWTAASLEEGTREVASLAAGLRAAADAGPVREALARPASRRLACLDNRGRDTGTASVVQEAAAPGVLAAAEAGRLADELRRRGYAVSASGPREVRHLLASRPDGLASVRIEQVGARVRAWIGTGCLRR